jgi:hypothetical protein
VSRVYEPSAFRALTFAREAESSFGFRGWSDLFFRWVPNFIRAKGIDRDQDLMWKHGLKELEGTGEPLTLPADLYFRFGLIGIALGYFAIGIIFGCVSWHCRSRRDTVRWVGVIAMGVVSIRLYAMDFVHVVWVPFFEWPIGMLFGLLLFAGVNRCFRLSAVRFGSGSRTHEHA